MPVHSNMLTHEKKTKHTTLLIYKAALMVSPLMWSALYSIMQRMDKCPACEIAQYNQMAE